ncbi:MAG: SMC-Scp complex subunit ScpB [Deltaproteobacteria bacterium RBG_16_71_12]|nr:MAG: SMC-Scp complex subunit ScpB [Deltaproteobacteria bacterium RBG_16_71_12]
MNEDDGTGALEGDVVEPAPGDAARATDDEQDAGVTAADEQPAAFAADDEQPAGGAADDEQPAGLATEAWVLSAIEALVFASTEPLQAPRARDVIAAEMETMDGMEGLPPPTTADVERAFRVLLERWGDPLRSMGHGFRLVEVDGGLCFRTAAANARFQRRMLIGRPQRLSRAGLETLAVVSYRQPVTKPQIEEIRGVDSSGALKALLDKKLVRVLGKAEEIGRPLLYGTTKTFLEFFGMASLNDLPTLKELHELEHGVTEPPAEDDERPAVIMDLFNADAASAVSVATEAESNEALDALEKALGEAKDVAKRASALVFGIQVEDEDAAAPAAADAVVAPVVEAPAPTPATEAADAAPPSPTDGEGPKG